MSNWEQLKLRTALYQIKCCPSCGHEDLCPRAEGPSWSCQKCCVKFIVTNPSYLKRKPKDEHPKRNQTT